MSEYIGDTVATAVNFAMFNHDIQSAWAKGLRDLILHKRGTESEDSTYKQGNLFVMTTKFITPQGSVSLHCYLTDPTAGRASPVFLLVQDSLVCMTMEEYTLLVESEDIKPLECNITHYFSSYVERPKGRDIRFIDDHIKEDVRDHIEVGYHRIVAASIEAEKQNALN